MMYGRKNRDDGSDVRMSNDRGLPETDQFALDGDLPVKAAIEDHRYDTQSFIIDPGVSLDKNQYINQPEYIFPEIIPEDPGVKESPFYLQPNAPKASQKHQVILY